MDDSPSSQYSPSSNSSDSDSDEDETNPRQKNVVQRGMTGDSCHSDDGLKIEIGMLIGGWGEAESDMSDISFDEVSQESSAEEEGGHRDGKTEAVDSGEVIA